MDADGVLVGLLEGGRVLDGVRIEHDKIGEVTFANRASLRDAELCGGEACHASHGFGEGQRTLVPDVLAENPWKRPIRPRMRRALGERALGADRGCIRPDADRAPLQTGLDVLLAHHVVERADAPAGVQQQLKEDVPGLLPSFCGNVGDAFPNDRAICLARHRRDLNALERRAQNQVLPAVDGRLDLAPGTRARRGILQALQHLLAAAFLHPQRQRGR
jgi:hypothetical protein